MATPAKFNRDVFAPFYEEIRSPHYGVVIAAIAISFLAHYAAMALFHDKRITTAPVDIPHPAETKPAVPPSHVERLHEDPLQHADDPVEGLLAESQTTPRLQSPDEVIDSLASLPDPALAAPPAMNSMLDGTYHSIDAPDVKPVDFGWEPRQEVLSIDSRIARDDIATLPRLKVPNIERIAVAHDYVPPVSVTRDRFALAPLPVPKAPPGAIPSTPPPALPPPPAPAEPVAEPEVAKIEETIERITEKPADISKFHAVDERLMAYAEILRPAASDRAFFRLQLAPRDMKEMPIAPKDIVFVQDASRSLAEARLHFCREALVEAIHKVSPKDRFNVATFRENTTFCFPSWTRPNPQSLAQATEFINAIRAKGDTDVLSSMISLLDLPRDRTRPLIVILITDGKATTGRTASSQIISEFTKRNDNVSIYAIGTHPGANQYLLDLLTFCNRGGSRISPDKFSIKKTINEIVEATANPVLGTVGVTTAIASDADLYPLPSANLYANRTLEYYGSCPIDSTNITFQIRGEGGKTQYDALFQIDLSHARNGGAGVQQEWARRKMHSLIGSYARNPDPRTYDAMRRLNAETGVPIPYLKQLGH